MATKSIKAQVLEYLQAQGYREDRHSLSRKYVRLVKDGFVPIYVGKAGAFRRGHTLADSVSITDQLRAQLNLPAYGDMGRCDICHHTTIADHKRNHGCIMCACRRYSGAAGWNGALVDTHTGEIAR